MEHLGLDTSKLNKRAKNEAKNRENLKNSQRAPHLIFGTEIFPNILTFSHGPSIGRDGAGALPENDCRVKTHGPPTVGKNVYARGTSDAALKAV